MYKTKLLFIFLGLIIPLLCAKSIIGDDFTRETNIKRGKADPNHNIDNAEEVLDFWDFNPHATKGSGLKSSKSGALPVLKPNKAKDSSKAYGTKAEREKIKQIDTLLKEMEQMLNVLEHKKTRVLAAAEPVPAPELTINGEDDNSNGEESINEEVIIPGGNEEEEEATTPGDDDEEQFYEGDNASGDFSDDGMSTAKLYALLRYDMTLQNFVDQGGQNYFIERATGVLGIQQDEMRILSIRQGSVIIEFEVVLTGGLTTTQEELEQQIQGLATKLNDAVASGKFDFFNGAAILNYEPQVILYSNNPTSDKTSGNGYIIGLTVGLAFITLAFVTFLIWRTKRVNEPKLLGRQQIYKTSLPESQVNLDLEDRVNEPNEPGSPQFEESDSMKMYAASVSPASGSGSGSGSDEDNKESRQRQRSGSGARQEKKDIFPKIKVK
jgi:hypothetical protein